MKIAAKEQKAFGSSIIELSKFKNNLDQSKIDYPTFNGSVNISNNKSPFLSQSPAVYFFHDLRGIHYIGETENLRLRFFQHMKKNKNLALEARKRLCVLISSEFENMDLNISKKDLITKLNEKCYIIKIKCGDFDKYGRLLGWLYDKNSVIDTPIEQSFNHILIKEHLAYKYEGKTKLTEEDQLELLK